MNRHIRINTVLFGLVIALSLFLALPNKDNEPTLLSLSDIDQNHINKIEILRQDMEDFIFHKRDAVWYMQSPLQYRANIARINAILRLLGTKSYTQLDPGEHPLERFHLEYPMINVKLNEYEFSLGNTEAIDQRRYVFFNGKIHLVNDFLYQQLTGDATFYADTKLLPDNFTIDAMVFPDNRIDRVDEAWQMQILMDISPTQLEHLVKHWQDASAISVSPYQQPKEENQIVIYNERGEEVIFIIITTEPYLVLGRKDIGIQYHMGSNDNNNLLLRENPASDASTEKPLG